MATNFGYSTLKTTGTVSSSLNIIFLAEGFQQSEIPAFNQACQNFMNTMLINSPFLESAALLNFYSVPVISSQSGISHPDLWPTGQCNVVPVMPKTTINSYFGLTYDCFSYHRFICPNNTQTLNIYNILSTSIPFFNPNKANFIPILICNDINYGGSESGNVVCVTLHTLCEEVLLHELGHDIGGLDDEYIGGTEIESWNLTQNTNLSTVRWAALESQGAGIVEVGTEPWYKPTTTCKMNFLGVGYCIVCRNQIYKGIYQLITMAGGKPNVQLPLGNSVVIDPVAVVTTPPVVNAPTNVTISNITTGSAQVNFSGSGTAYNVKLGNSVYNTTSSFYNFTGLVPNTSYPVSVQASYEGILSAYTSPVSFTTLTQSIIIVTPPTSSSLPPTGSSSPITGSNSAGIWIVSPNYLKPTSVILECPPTPGTKFYLFNIYDVTGKVKVQTSQHATAPNTAIAFTGLTPGTTYNITMALVLTSGAQLSESTPLTFTTPTH